MFAALGVLTHDGLWPRKQCLILAKTNSTPVYYWLSLPLKDLRIWIEAHNAVLRDEQEARKHK